MPEFERDSYSCKEECSKNLPENILNQEFFSCEPHKKLVTDISYFKIKGGWLFLSMVLDLYNNQVLSYNYSKHPDTEIY